MIKNKILWVRTWKIDNKEELNKPARHDNRGELSIIRGDY